MTTTIDRTVSISASEVGDHCGENGRLIAEILNSMGVGGGFAASGGWWRCFLEAINESGRAVVVELLTAIEEGA